MENHQFILILNRPEELSSPVIEEFDLSEIPGSQWISLEGTTALQMNRESETLQEAILSAIEDVNSSSLPFTVERVGEYDLVTKPVIVDRAGISNRRIFEFINGERGPGNFPKPLYEVGVTQFYSWKEIQKWLSEHAGFQSSRSNGENLPEIINSLISLKKAGASQELLNEIWNRLSSIQPDS